MQTGLGGPAGYGPLSLPRSDDGGQFLALGAIFTSGLRIGGQVWTGLWVNTNGTLSFGGPLAGYDAAAIGAAAGPVIAVFAADVDTRLRGEGTESGMIWVHQAPGVLTVTWAEVGFFRRNTDLVNSFQVQIRAVGGQDADLSLSYGDVNWLSGDLDGGSGGLGGTAPLAGIRAGGAFQPIGPSGNAAAWLSLPTKASWEITLRNGVAQGGGGAGPPGGGSDPGDPDPGDGGDRQITGIVLDRDDAPMQGVTLRLINGAAPIAETVTDATGAFAFDLPANGGVRSGLRLDVLRDYSAGSDGRFDIMDVLALFRLVAGAVPASAYDSGARLAADYGGNGIVDIFDVLALFRHVAGVPGVLGPRFVFIEEDALAAGFGPDPMRVPVAADLPGAGLLALGLEGPLTLIGLLSGDII